MRSSKTWRGRLSGNAQDRSAPDAAIDRRTQHPDENCRIAAIGVGLNVDGAEVIDGAGRIVIPGLVNAHMHGWQTALRGVAHDCTIVEYMAWMYGLWMMWIYILRTLDCRCWQARSTRSTAARQRWATGATIALPRRTQTLR